MAALNGWVCQEVAVKLDQVMTPSPITVEAETPISRLALAFVQNSLSHLLVVDDDRRLLGLVIEANVFKYGTFDLDRSWQPFRVDDYQPVARDLLAAAELVLRPSEEVRVALDGFMRGVADAAVMVDSEHKPVGIFTEHDAVRMAAESLSEDLLATQCSGTTVLALPIDSTAGDAVDILAVADIRHLVVLDQNRLAGVLSWRDLLESNASRNRGRSIRSMLAETAVETAGTDATLRSVADQMVRQRIGCVPILDEGGKVQGLVTRIDLMRAMRQSAL